MDRDIKKSSTPMKQSDYDALLEYKPTGTQKPDIVDERVSLDGIDDVVTRAKKYREERLSNRQPYPWEEEERPYIVAKSTQDPQPYVRKTYYVNGFFSSDPSTETIVETVEGTDGNKTIRKRVVTRNKNIIRVIGKLKGGKTTFVNAADAGSYTLGNLSPLAAAPPANPQQKSREIAELKADPGYQYASNGRWRIQVAKNGGDRWLSALYDECVQMRAVFWHIMFVMGFESGLLPTATNPVSNAQGLIQWIPGGWGLFRQHGFANPKQADAFQQLPFVRKYYQGRSGWKKNGVRNLVAAYTMVAGGNTSDPNKVIYTKSKKPKVFRQNPLWDLNNDGLATGGEMTLSVVRKWYGVSDNSWIKKYPNGIWRKEPVIFQLPGLRG